MRTQGKKGGRDPHSLERAEFRAGQDAGKVSQWAHIDERGTGGKKTPRVAWQRGWGLLGWLLFGQ